MIESPEGVAAAEGIAAVDGVDCLLIGLVDLSASLAAEGAGAAELSDAVAAVAAATRLHGKALGLSAGAAETAARHREAGASFLTIPLNSLITTGLKSFESVLGGSR